MTTLIVILSVILVLIFICTLKFSFCLNCDNIVNDKNANLSAVLKIGFLKIKLFPLKPKRRKRKEKEKKIKGKTVTVKEKKKRKKSKENIEREEVKEVRSIRDTIIFAIVITKKLLLNFKKYLKFDFGYIAISIASNEAYKTAMLYGSIVQSVSYLKTFLEYNLNAKFTKIFVVSNFAEEKTKFKIDIKFSIRLYQILNIGFTALFGFLKEFVFKKKNNVNTNI